jgi:hypothetical protein
LRSEIARLMTEGRNPIMTIDVQGAVQFVQAFPEAVLIFLLPPSAVELRIEGMPPLTGAVQGRTSIRTNTRTSARRRTRSTPS